MKIDKIIKDLVKIKGLSNVKLLTKEDKKQIIKLENKSNVGVIECAKRKYTLVLTHDDKFRKPIGEIVINKDGRAIFPPIPFPEVKAKNVVSSSPSEKVHSLLVKKYNLEIINSDATLLIGFD
ncbi:hypothetical protein HYX19_03515 [Candidatus Woesearchaeota archaeon]|nr:hypothetical protein [Candidatus Woesearchaeota archaeon]